MNKQLIAFFRISIYLIVIVFYEREVSNFNFEYKISDLIFGIHSPEIRSSTTINLIMVAYYGILSYYTIQTILYVVIGAALEGKRTGIIRFLGLLISGIREAAEEPNFWTSSNTIVETDQIDRVLQYRDSKIALMSNREAVEYMRGTGHVDLMMTRLDLKQSKKVLGYMNNRMALMDNETALKFIKGDDVN